MFNTLTKRMVVGSTSSTIYSRFKSHLTGRVDNLSRRAANYIVNKGPHLWIILPIEYLSSKLQQYESEGRWARVFLNYLINNPIQLTTFKPTRKPCFNGAKNQRDNKRADERKLQLVNWRSYMATIFHTNLWHSWHELPLINLLLNIRKAKLTSSITQNFTYLIRNHLKKKFKLELRPYYTIKIPTSSTNSSHRIKSWIKRMILTHDKSAYAMYIANHLRITSSTIVTFKQLICNQSQFLKYFDYKENLAPCYCHMFPELKNNDKHITIKASQLPDVHSKLRSILCINSKTPAILPYKAFLGIIFANIKSFLSKNLLHSKWNLSENEELFKISFRKKTFNMDHLKTNIVETLSAYSPFLCFSPLDKNINAWAIECPYMMIERYIAEFTNTKYYNLIDQPVSDIKDVIETAYRQNILSILRYPTRTSKSWKLSSASLLPKNKDTSRSRTLVSYFHHISRPVGRKIARCLTLMVKKLSHLWNTMELHSIKEFIPRISTLFESPLWKSASERNSITFLKLDIRNQFTNLSKKRVLIALDHALLTLRKFASSKRLCFAIRTREYERKYDHIGHPYQHKEIGFPPYLIRAFIQYELDFPYFQVNNQIFKQINGLPMGGFNSAPLACLDSMLQEHLHPLLWQDASCFRYRDDIFAVFPKKLSEFEITDFHNRLSHLYGPDLSVQLESISYSAMDFLEFHITSNLTISHFNKNMALPQSPITRYLPPDASLPHHIFKGTIIGAIKRALSSSLSSFDRLVSIMSTMGEFLKLGYSAGILSKAINSSHIPLPFILYIRKFFAVLLSFVNS
jgi:hypothetical protein